MLRLPTIRGIIRRRLLVNFRVDAEVMQRYLPAPFRPKLHNGYAIAGICLIRLEQIRPDWLPLETGLSSENAAHRIAVRWDEGSTEREGVFIPRRDTSSTMNHLTGGRVFPGEHHRADFAVTDTGGTIAMSIQARDGGMSVSLRARESDALPATSCFATLAESSAYFEGGSVGYSVTKDCCRLDGIRLVTERWEVRPLEVEEIRSSFFSDETVFPAGSVVFDHALIMRDIAHTWEAEPEMASGEKAAVS